MGMIFDFSMLMYGFNVVVFFVFLSLVKDTTGTTQTSGICIS